MRDRRILVLTGVELAVAAGGLLAVVRHGPGVSWPSPWALAGLAALFALLGLLPPLHVELRRNAYWVTLSEALVPVTLFALGPVAAVAPLAGEVVLAVVHRQPWLKSTFNFAQVGAATVLATVTFIVLGPADPLHPAGWGAALAALAVYTAFNALSISTVLGLAGGVSVLRTVRQVVPTALVTFIACASLGVAAVILFERTPLAPALFLPVLGLLVLGTQGLETQRSERSRFERLYAASSRLTRLGTIEETLGAVAEEAARLVTGAAAICGTADDGGSPVAVLADDRGRHVLPRHALAALGDFRRTRHPVPVSALPAPWRTLLPDGGYLLFATSGPGAPPESDVVLAVALDMTPDDQDERRLEVLGAFAAHVTLVVANVRLYHEVQQALRHEMALNRQKSDFVATVSHELRTPLAAMLGALQTLRRLGDRLTDENRERMLELGFIHGHRLQRLIEDLLLVASAEHRDVQCRAQPVPLASFLADIAAELRTTATQGRLSIDAPGALGVIVSDDDKLRHIVVNLIDNAAKYAPNGPIELEARRDGREVVISVSDHGPGIPPADRERVFERFVQLDQSSTRRQGGTGLGLYLCRQLAQVLGGTLVAGERPGGGARFELRIPVGPTPSAPSATPRPGHRSRIMRRPDGIQPALATASASPGGTP